MPANTEIRRRIFAPVLPRVDTTLQMHITQLRQQGEIVLHGLTGEMNEPYGMECTHILQWLDNQWQVIAIS
jgi:predicted alpha/beta-fold hydrolase